MQLKVNKELFNKKAEEKGLTQGQIAEKVGRKRDWVVRFLQGKQMSQFKTILRVCDLLGVKMDELIKSEKTKNHE